MSVSKSFYSEQDNTITCSSPCLKTKMKKLTKDTEWAEMVRHQAKVAQDIIKQEKETKKQNKTEIRNALDNLVKEKELKKQEKIVHKQKEGEQANAAKMQFDNEIIAKRHHAKSHKKSIVDHNKQMIEASKDLAKNKKENELKIEEKMINHAKMSLEQEKLKKQEKKAELKRYANEILALKEIEKKEKKEAKELEKVEYNKMLEDHEHHHNMKQKQYKQFYQKCTDHQMNLHRTHSDFVLKKKMERDQHIHEFIQKNIESHEKKIANEEQQRRIKKKDDLKNTHEANRSMILENEKKRKDERDVYHEKVKQTLQEIESLNTYLDQARMEKRRQKEQYREMLRQQSAEKERRALSAIKMSHHEKTLNGNDLDHYRNSEVKLRSMVPGLSQNKHHRVRSTITKSLNNLVDVTPTRPRINDDVSESNGSTTITESQLNIAQNDYSPTGPDVKWHHRTPEAVPIYSRGKSCHQLKNDRSEASVSPNRAPPNDKSITEESETTSTTSKIQSSASKSELKSQNQANVGGYKSLNRSVSRGNYGTSNLDYLFSTEQFNNNVNNKKGEGYSRDRSKSPLSHNNSHNPITNPLPYTMQNPYILREIQKGMQRVG